MDVPHFRMVLGVEETEENDLIAKNVCELSKDRLTVLRNHAMLAIEKAMFTKMHGAGHRSQKWTNSYEQP